MFIIAHIITYLLLFVLSHVYNCYNIVILILFCKYVCILSYPERGSIESIKSCNLTNYQACSNELNSSLCWREPLCRLYACFDKVGLGRTRGGCYFLLFWTLMIFLSSDHPGADVTSYDLRVNRPRDYKSPRELLKRYTFQQKREREREREIGRERVRGEKERERERGE